jgi:hypothetical protein
MGSYRVEYWKVEQKVGGSHAQMSENIPIIKPDPKDISRRYFSDHKSASKFVKSIFDKGFHSNLIRE